MKIIRLRLEKSFRSLPDNFGIDFLREQERNRVLEFHPYCFAGLNGNGKSNVLEALAAIFYHIECTDLHQRQEYFQYNPEEAVSGFDPTRSDPDTFEIEYFFPRSDGASSSPSFLVQGRQIVHIHIVKQAKKKAVMSFVCQSIDNGKALVDIPESEINNYLPSFVLGYSSGRNEILSLLFSKMRFVLLDEYQKTLSEDLIYDGQPTGRSIFIDDQFSQAILLCHYLFPTEPVLKIFKRETGLTGIRRFRIIIRRFHRIKYSKEILDTLTEKEREDIEKTTVELTSKLDLQNRHFRLGIIGAFIKCATCYSEDRSNYRDEKAGDSYDLILDYWIGLDDTPKTVATREAFMFHFGELETKDESQRIADASLKLFRALQTLLTLNYYQTREDTKAELYSSHSLYSSETIPIPASHDRIMRFKDFELLKDGVSSKLYNRALSDGEYQLLNTIGLCLLFRHKPCLFLLDEPETHLNPDWRASYISTLREAFSSNDRETPIMREVLLTSHSPFIISDCHPENVLIFKKNSTGKITYRRPDFNTFGASANAITMKVFGQKETIGDYANKQLMGFQKRLEQGEDPDALIDEASRELGDSVEKVFFVNRALDRKERS